MSNVSTIDRFPLLRLPRIALQEVLKPMNPFELIEISKTSLKSKEIVKSFLNTKQCKREYKIQLDISIVLKISIDGTYNSYTFLFKPGLFLKEHKVFDRKEKVILYSKDIVEDFKEYLKLILNIFNSGITTLGLLGGSAFRLAGEPIVDWLKVANKSIKCLVVKPSCVTGSNFKVEEVDYVLNSLLITDCIELHINMESSFRPVIPPLSNRFYIANGHWITLTQLSKFNCPIIQIRLSKLTNQDINKFIKSWINLESSLNLKYFETNIYDGNMDEICNGLEIKTIDPNFVRSMFEVPAKLQVFGGIEIRRNKEVTATLSLSFDRFRMMINQV